MIKSYEALIAITIISLALVLFFKDYQNFQKNEFDSTKLFNILKKMDLEGKLRNYVLSNNSTEIEKRISYILPGYEIFVLICDLNCSKPNISESYSITYLISGNFTFFSPKQLIVYVIK